MTVLPPNIRDFCFFFNNFFNYSSTQIEYSSRKMQQQVWNIKLDWKDKTFL